MKYVDVLNKVAEELTRAEDKFPGFPEDCIHAAAVVGEEAGEILKACLQATYQGAPWSAVEKEAVQTAAMAVRFLINLEQMKRRPSVQV